MVAVRSSGKHLYNIMREKFSEYYDGDRKAVVRKSDKGWEVDLFIKDEILETREVHDKSELYEENLAENYV